MPSNPAGASRLQAWRPVRRVAELGSLADMRAHFPKLSREEALKELSSFIAELDAGWERDGLDWAPGLLKILRAFVAEASKQSPDSHQLESLHGDVHAYFKRYKFLKGIFFVREWVDMIYEDRDFDVG